MATAKTKGKSKTKSVSARSTQAAKAKKADSRSKVQTKTAAKSPSKTSGKGSKNASAAAKPVTRAAAKNAAKNSKKTETIKKVDTKKKVETSKVDVAKAKVAPEPVKVAVSKTQSKTKKKATKEVKIQKPVTEKAVKVASPKGKTEQPAAPAPAAKAPEVATVAVAPKAAKPAVTPSPAPTAQAPAPKSTATHERTDVIKKKTDQPATVIPEAKAAPVAPASVAAPTTAPAAAKPAPAKAPEAKAADPKAAGKSATHRTGFKANEFIVYPAHGVGQIIAIEEQEVAGFKLELFVINFVKDKMTLKVPLPKVLNGAIRKLAEPETVKKALDTLTGRARIKRTMWSRRAQEYEAKINSGDLGSIAEVVRDLYRSDAQPEQSYSERQLYEAALDRMAREIAAVQKLIENEALKLIETQLQRGPKRGSKTDVIEVEVVGEVDGEIEQAA